MVSLPAPRPTSASRRRRGPGGVPGHLPGALTRDARRAQAPGNGGGRRALSHLTGGEAEAAELGAKGALTAANTRRKDGVNEQPDSGEAVQVTAVHPAHRLGHEEGSGKARRGASGATP